MLLFFVVMQLKGVHKFKAMADYAKYRYVWFGFNQAPSRKTIRRRFLEMPGFIRWLLPCLAREVTQIDQRISLRVGFVDKSIFQALGGIWHKKHQQAGVVPHPSIDTDASWGKSSYHGWRFGYGLHLVVNRLRFPLAATVTTAAAPDKAQVWSLLNGMLPQLLLLVGDASYRAIRFLKNLWDHLEVMLITHRPFTTRSKAKQWRPPLRYNQWVER
ncbi:MAG: transposase [Bacteroidota bacterium]